MPKFSNKQNLNKSNIAGVPDNTAAVYEFLDGKGNNIYTGIAGRVRVQQRLMEHLSGGEDKIPGAKQFRVAQVGNKVEAKKIEDQIIKKEQPKFNIQGK